MSGRWTIMGVLAWAATLGVASGQEQSAPRRAQERQAEAFRMVDAYLIANIQESLELSDEQFAQIIPLVKELQKTRRGFAQERQRTLRSMRMLLQSGSATETQLEEAVNKLKALELEGPPRVREKQDALDAVLTPVQQAKYRVFEAEVERRIRELSRRFRRERMPQNRDNP